MKRIDGSDVWTDGKIKYRKNERGELVIYVEEPSVVEPDEEIVLKPVDKEQE